MRQPSDLPPGVTMNMIEEQAGVDHCDFWYAEECGVHCLNIATITINGRKYCDELRCSAEERQTMTRRRQSRVNHRHKLEEFNPGYYGRAWSWKEHRQWTQREKDFFRRDWRLRNK